MKIKLIHMPRVYLDYNYRQGLLPPIGIATLTGVLRKKGYHVDQDDLNIKVDYDTKISKSPWTERVNLSIFEDKDKVKRFLEDKNEPSLEEEAEKILRKTSYKGYDIVGLSLLDETIFSVISIAMVISKMIKERTGSYILLGGLTYPRPMVEFKEMLNTGYIDCISRAHGETAMLNICYGLENGCLDELKIPFTLRKDDNIKERSKNPPYIHNMNDFFRPDFDGLPLELYRYKPSKELKATQKNISVLMLPYIFTNGCPNKCIFCPMSYYDEHGIKDTVSIAEDLEYLSKRHNTRYFFFINSHVNPMLEYVKGLIHEFKSKDLNIMWTDCANFRHTTKEVIKQLREVGAVKLIYGLECPSDRLLKYIAKGITVSYAEKMLKISHEAGIWNEIELIAGLPYEKEEDINRCLNFLERNKEYIDFGHLGKFILKDSLLYKYPEKYGLCNIRDNMDNMYNIKEFTRCFDETNGLKWDEKEKQIIHSFKTVYAKLDAIQKERNLKYMPTMHMPLLFYLYTAFSTKDEVKSHFNEYYKAYQEEMVPLSFDGKKSYINAIRYYLKKFV